MMRGSVKKKVACVTGATGYLASELIAQLLERGFRVHGTVRSGADPARISSLQELPGAPGSLQLFEADLLRAGSFDASIVGADCVFHTASPFVTSNIQDVEQELYMPALHGTRNVFDAIVRSVAGGGRKPRVVFTSSIAAVFGPGAKPKGQLFCEDDWNTSSSAKGTPVGDGHDLYRYSKLIAEKEAWALAQANSLEMSSICPSFLLGPPRTPRTDGESLRNMRMALEGEMPHRADTLMVDVRDCAAAHLAAAETQRAVGKRFITSTKCLVPRAHLLGSLQTQYPELELFDRGSVSNIASLPKIVSSNSLHMLPGVRIRDPRSTILDMAETMLRFGVVTPLLREPLSPQRPPPSGKAGTHVWKEATRSMAMS